MDKPPSTRETICIAALFTAGGFYLVLVGLGQLPPPSRQNGPAWLGLLAGCCFLFGGLAVLVPAAVTRVVSTDGELPLGAPRWLRVFQYAMILAIASSLASIGTWVAFAPGTRSFSVSAPFISGGTGELIGRIAFGFGAAITWLCLIAFGVHGWRKLRNKP